MWKASTAPLVVLTGGPGCGKTFATKAIVQVWAQQRKDIRLAAPTGAAPCSAAPYYMPCSIMEMSPALPCVYELSHIVCI